MKTIELGEVSLNVRNLKKQTAFYENIIGLDVIEESSQRVDLGIKKTGEVLVSLVQVDQEFPREKMTGLFHLALLLPDRAALGGILRYFLEIKAPLGGASDHGYSEALYLQDPEGNGIEIYRDKDRSEWDIREDGSIKGITVEMDATGVMMASPGILAKMPEGTKMGHVHLTVNDLEKTVGFYRDALGFALTDKFGAQARFFGMDGYHHQVAANNWAGSDSIKRNNDLPGLNYYKIIWETEEEFNNVKQQLADSTIELLEEENKTFKIMDPNGIMIHMELKK